MSGAPFVDVLIALALCFGAVAAGSSFATEIWSRAVASRASGFSKAVGGLLGDPACTQMFMTISRNLADAGVGVTTERSLWGIVRRKEPMLSGASAEVFIDAAVEHLRTSGFFNGAPAAAFLEPFRNNEAGLRAFLAKGFAAVSQTSTVDYRSRSVGISVAAAFLIAWAFNADALAVAERAYKAATTGEQRTPNDLPVPATAPAEIGALFDRLRGTQCRPAAEKIGGIDLPKLDFSIPASDGPGKDATPVLFPCSPFNVTTLLGWLFSALLSIPGASFWYDLVAKLAGYRSAAR